MRKIFATILVLISVACLFVACKNNDNNNKKDVFVVYNGEIVGLTEYGKTLSYIEVPSQINGQDITKIPGRLFYKNETILSVVLNFYCR